MSDTYANHLLQRHLDGKIFEEEIPTLKALLQPCIENDTANPTQRRVFSQLVLHCLQLLPTHKRIPKRTCNKHRADKQSNASTIEANLI